MSSNCTNLPACVECNIDFVEQKIGRLSSKLAPRVFTSNYVVATVGRTGCGNESSVLHNLPDTLPVPQNCTRMSIDDAFHNECFGCFGVTLILGDRLQGCK